MVTPSRLAVAQALLGVFDQGSRIEDAWDRDLEAADAALAQAMLGLCLRRWGRLQAFLNTHLRQPDRGVPTATRVAAALGLVQLAWLPGVSSHAAVHEAVELMGHPRLGFAPHRGLLNAILRKASQDRSALADQLEALDSELDRSAFVDRALVSALRPRQALDQLESLWARLQQIPSPSFHRIFGEPLPEGLEIDPLCPGGLQMSKGSSFPRAWLSSGAGMVQDRSSQALMSFQWEGRPRRMVDLCAAPGGKTTTLALRWPGAELIAVEQDARRARRLEQNLHQRHLHAKVVVEDAERWLRQEGEAFDLILLDAPCSASGTLQKHPELAWIGGNIKLQRLQDIQRRLLHAALGRLAPGGLLIYAVCSWFPEEGLAHRESLLNTHPQAVPIPIWEPKFGLSEEPTSIFLPDPLTWPGEGFQGFALTRS